jgi:hypothetical protein
LRRGHVADEGPTRGAKPKSSVDRGISAGHVCDTASGCVVYTASDNASTTQLEGPSSYIVDTRNRLEITAATRADSPGRSLSCPTLGAKWERRLAGKPRQTRSTQRSCPARMPLTCRNGADHLTCRAERSVRDEEAAGSNPATPTTFSQLEARFHDTGAGFLDRLIVI